MMNPLYNWQQYYGSWAAPFGAGFFFGLGALAVLLLILWSFYWKGMALWKAARAGEKVWFVILLVINTLGILEILYLYIFSGKSKPVKE